MSFDFFVKSNIKFGRGAAEKLPELINAYGLKHVMVVYDSGVKAAGIADKVLEQIHKTGAAVTVFDDVIPNPTNEIVEKASGIAKNAQVDGFVAVGGGSSIDTAKAINVLMTNPGKISDYAGMNMVKHPCLPLIAIPTTAGTSSEITNVSALIDTEKVIKYVVIDNKITASDVIADPEFTRTVPAGVTAATGMDAITHAAESYLSNMATPLTKYQALEGLRILYQNITRAVENGEDMEAREQMMLQKDKSRKPVLIKENIVLDCKAVTPEEAIIHAGELLLRSGYIKSGYISGMLSRDENFSVYLGNMLAIAHGEKGVRDQILGTGMSVLICPDGIDWHGNLVKIVMGLAAIGDEHMELLMHCANIFSDRERVERLVRCRDRERVYRMFGGI